MDRFLMKVLVSYPDPEAELRVLRLVRSEEAAAAGGDSAQAPPPLSAEVIFRAREEIHALHISEAIEQYIVDLVTATREPEKYSDELRSWIDVGSSPRGALSLDRASRAHAWLYDQDHVSPDNVRAVARDVLRHRITRSYEASAGRVSTDRIVDEIVRQVAVA